MAGDARNGQGSLALSDSVRVLRLPEPMLSRPGPLPSRTFELKWDFRSLPTGLVLDGELVAWKASRTSRTYVDEVRVITEGQDRHSEKAPTPRCIDEAVGLRLGSVLVALHHLSHPVPHSCQAARRRKPWPTCGLLRTTKGLKDEGPGWGLRTGAAVRDSYTSPCFFHLA